MPVGKIKMFNEERGFGFIRPDDGTADVFFHVSSLAEGDHIATEKKVRYETGQDRKTGKIRALTVDLIKP